MVITEFDAGNPEATMQALADEILRYRQALRLLAKAVGGHVSLLVPNLPRHIAQRRSPTPGSQAQSL